MEIRSLQNVEFSQIYNCFLEGFSDYSVPISSSQDEQEFRWKGARVDYSLSAGIWERDQLVGIIITGVNSWNGQKTAFNLATCMIPEYRGRKGPKRMYELLFPLFTRQAITQCMLEVIQTNERAVHVYKKIGFSISRSLHCYEGAGKTLIPPKSSGFTLEKMKIADWESIQHWWEFEPSWEQGMDALQIKWNSLDMFGLLYKGNWIGYVIANRKGQIFQFGLDSAYRTTLILQYLFSPLAIYESLKMINVDSRADFSNEALQEIGLRSIGSQYEMLMPLQK